MYIYALHSPWKNALNIITLQKNLTTNAAMESDGLAGGPVCFKKGCGQITTVDLQFKLNHKHVVTMRCEVP